MAGHPAGFDDNSMDMSSSEINDKSFLLS